MKNLILVIGRSGAGKDTLVKAAIEILKDSHRLYLSRLIRTDLCAPPKQMV